MKTSFYCAEHIAALKRKSRIWTLILVLVCSLTLGAVVYFAASRTTLNAKRMEFLATAALTAGGWIAIAVADCGLQHCRAMCAHEKRILSSTEPARELRGLVTLEKKRVSISGSIDVRSLLVKSAEGSVRLLVNAFYARALEKESARGELTLRTVEGYVTEVER